MKIEWTAAERTRLRQAMKQAACKRCFWQAKGRRPPGIAAVTGASVRRVPSWWALTWRPGQRTPPPAKRVGGEAAPGARGSVLPALDRPRRLTGLAQDPWALGKRGVALDRAAVGRASAPTRPPAYRGPHLAPSLAGGGSALEATPLRLCRTGPARGPEKRALARAMKTLPAGGRLLALDETTLRHRPPRRAAWAGRGKQAVVRISGKNARRALFGTVDLRTGQHGWPRAGPARVWSMTRAFGGGDATGPVPAVRSGSCWTATAATAIQAACAWLHHRASACSGCRVGIPKLNPVEHLWRQLAEHPRGQPTSPPASMHSPTTPPPGCVR